MVGMSYRDPVTKQLIALPMGCAGGGSPVGVVEAYAGSTAPTGWVIADGRAHNSPALLSLLGSANTPDLRGKFILAASPTHAAKTSGGEETHLLTAAESGVAEHSHETTLRTTAGSTNSADGPVRGQSSSAASAGFRSGVVAASSAYESTLGPKPAASAHNNMPPYYALMYIMKAWAESAIGGITLEDADDRYVKKTGDTVTGRLFVNNGNANLALLDAPSGTGVVLERRIDSGREALRVLKGDYSALAPVVAGAPTNSDDLATKLYVDTNRRVGVSVSGTVTLTTANQAIGWALLAAEAPNDSGLWNAANPERFLAPVAGLYQLDYTIRIDSINGTIGVTKVGGEIVRSDASNTRVVLVSGVASNGASAAVMTQTITLRLPAGASIALYLNSGSNAGTIQGPAQSSSYASWRYLGV